MTGELRKPETQERIQSRGVITIVAWGSNQLLRKCCIPNLGVLWFPDSSQHTNIQDAGQRDHQWQERLDHRLLMHIPG